MSGASNQFLNFMERLVPYDSSQDSGVESSSDESLGPSLTSRFDGIARGEQLAPRVRGAPLTHLDLPRQRAPPAPAPDPGPAPAPRAPAVRITEFFSVVRPRQAEPVPALPLEKPISSRKARRSIELVEPAEASVRAPTGLDGSDSGDEPTPKRHAAEPLVDPEEIKRLIKLRIDSYPGQSLVERDGALFCVACKKSLKLKSHRVKKYTAPFRLSFLLRINISFKAPWADERWWGEFRD